MKILKLLPAILIMTLAASSRATNVEDKSGQIDALFQAFNQPDVPGACAAVIRDGKVVFSKAYGLANVEEKIPCTTNTDFRLASITKQFTAMAVLILLDQKKLSLGERLTDFFPEFLPYGKQITLRHLLSHTSGLIDYEDLIPDGTKIPVLDQDVLRLLMQQDKTSFLPGSKYRYSNSAYALLALIVQIRSGNTFAAFLKKNIFEPLGMKNTVAYEQGISVVPNRAYGYTVSSNGVTRTDQSLTSSVLGDGGIYSSVVDVFKWDQALYTAKLVSKKTLGLAFTAGIATDKPNTGYGFGWYIGSYRGEKEIWHSGETCGFNNRIARFPDRKFTVIILTNRRDAKLGEIPHKIADMFLFEPK